MRCIAHNVRVAGEHEPDSPRLTTRAGYYRVRLCHRNSHQQVRIRETQLREGRPDTLGGLEIAVIVVVFLFHDAGEREWLL